MQLASFLDDAPPGNVLCDCFCFRNGTEDDPDGEFFFPSEYDRALAAYAAAGLPFTVRFHPATPEFL
jgi:hypothetical protein